MAIIDELQRALAITDRRARAEATLALVAETMAGLGFEVTSGRVERETVSAASLDARQRAGLLELATYPKLSLVSYPVPSRAWAIRQWLGADPPGPLFAPADALYDALRAARRRSEQEALAMLLALPMPRRLHVLADLHLLPHDYPYEQVTYLLGNRHVIAPDPDPGCGRIRAEIGTDCGAWAEAIAARILEIEDAPPLYAHEEGASGTADTVGLYLPVLLAMARAGRIEPRYARFLGSTFDRWTDPRLLHECIAAIPDAHRQAAIETALANSRDQLVVQEQILPRYSSAAVARHVLANLVCLPKPKAALRTLKAMAKTNPAIAQELNAFEHAVPDLRVTDRRAPQLAELDDRAREQLETATLIEGNIRVTAAQVLGGEVEEYEVRWIERLRIENGDGEHAYDAWLVSPDQGTVFRAGTCEIVAELIQGGVDCADFGLRAALTDALAKPKPKKPTKKAARR